MENTCNQGGAKAFLKSYCRHFNLCALRIAIGWYGNLDENARILGATFEGCGNCAKTGPAGYYSLSSP